VALEKIGKYKEGEDAIRRAVALEPDNYLFRNNWGDLLLHLKQYTAAENQYLMASKFNEKYSLAYLGLAKVYIQLGEETGEIVLYEDAIEQLNKVAEIGIPTKDEDRFEYYFQKGYANVKLCNWKEAEKNFKNCGEDPKAKRNIRRMRNMLKKEKPSSRTILIGGWTVAIISIILLIFSSIQYFHSIKCVEQIDASLFKVLVPTFLFFSAVGFSLPFIRSIKGPGGIGFEKDIAVSSELWSSKTITFEQHLFVPSKFPESDYKPKYRHGEIATHSN
jgi:hypothetical protein